MLPRISNTTCIVLISIHTSFIDANNRPAISIAVFLISNRNNNNNCRRDLENYTMAGRCQKTTKRSASLFLSNNVYKHIRSTYFWLSCSITILFFFARTISSSTSMIYISMIYISINIFTISLSKNLAYAFFSSKDNIY